MGPLGDRGISETNKEKAGVNVTQNLPWAGNPEVVNPKWEISYGETGFIILLVPITKSSFPMEWKHTEPFTGMLQFGNDLCKVQIYFFEESSCKIWISMFFLSGVLGNGTLCFISNHSKWWLSLHMGAVCFHNHLVNLIMLKFLNLSDHMRYHVLIYVLLWYVKLKKIRVSCGLTWMSNDENP